MEEDHTQPEPVVVIDDVAEPPAPVPIEDAQLQAVLEAIIYVTEEPLAADKLAAALSQPALRVRGALDRLISEFDKPEHGIAVREVAGGFKIAPKPDDHAGGRAFVKGMKPALKVAP